MHIIKGLAYPLGGTLIFIICAFLLITGCLDAIPADETPIIAVDATVERGAIEVKPDVKAGLNTEIDDIQSSIEKINASLINSSKEIKSQFKEVKELAQTNNTGFMSGGAPYLLVVILALITHAKHRQAKKLGDEVKSKSGDIEDLSEKIRILETKNSEYRIQKIATDTEKFLKKSTKN